MIPTITVLYRIREIEFIRLELPKLIRLLAWVLFVFINTQVSAQCTAVGDSSGYVRNHTLTDSVHFSVSNSAEASFINLGSFTGVCGLTFPSIIAPWSGNTSSSNVTYSFSKPITSVRVIIGYTGVNTQIVPETFIFTTNGGTDPSIVVNSGSCPAWAIIGNQSTSPSIVGGLNSIHTINSTVPFNKLTITTPSNGTNGGSSYALCDRSVITCASSINLGPDTTLCAGEMLKVDATLPKAVYLWQDNSTNPSLTITAPGQYWVEVTDSCGMVISDTINVNYESIPSINLGQDTALCLEESLILDAFFPSASYLWQNGSIQSTFTVTEPGTYRVEVSNKCGTDSSSILVAPGDCDCNVHIPSSFTPNFDNLNDLFLPESDCDFTQYHLLIFNRWGEKIFETNQYNEPWSGNYQGISCSEGIYVYLITFKQRGLVRQKYGQVTLLK